MASPSSLLPVMEMGLAGLMTELSDLTGPVLLAMEGIPGAVLPYIGPRVRLWASVGNKDDALATVPPEARDLGCW